MKMYSIYTKTIGNELIYIRSHYKEQNAIDDVEFFKSNGSDLVHVIIEEEE